MKQRIVGAVVLVSLAVILLPMMLDGQRRYDRVIIKTNIPPKPKSFNSKVIPLEKMDPTPEVRPKTEKSKVVPTTSPHIKPLQPKTTTASPPATTQKPITKTVKQAPKPVEKPKAVTKAAVSKQPAASKEQKPVTLAQDSGAAQAVDKSTQLTRLEPTMSGQSIKPSAPQAGGAPVTDAPQISGSAWVVQVGSFGQETNANRLRDKLRKQGFSAFVERIYGKKAVSYRVRVGPELERKNADAIRNKIERIEKLKGIVVRYP